MYTFSEGIYNKFSAFIRILALRAIFLVILVNCSTTAGISQFHLLVYSFLSHHIIPSLFFNLVTLHLFSSL